MEFQMRAFLSLFALAAWPAMACDEVSFTVTDWSASEDAMAVEVEMAAPQSIRMASATIVFTDVLGRIVHRLPIPADTHAEPGPVALSYDFSGAAGHRLPNINPEDVTTSVTVFGVVYQDGSVCSS